MNTSSQGAMFPPARAHIHTDTHTPKKKKNTYKHLNKSQAILLGSLQATLQLPFGSISQINGPVGVMKSASKLLRDPSVKSRLTTRPPGSEWWHSRCWIPVLQVQAQLLCCFLRGPPRESKTQAGSSCGASWNTDRKEVIF